MGATVVPGPTILLMEDLLLAWFRREGRDLPWRHTTDPYCVRVSEVMLQQNRVIRVLPALVSGNA